MCTRPVVLKFGTKYLKIASCHSGALMKKKKKVKKKKFFFSKMRVFAR
eukprot:SAG11_NODE_3401_length_2468_cov_1.688054_5_plen_48_part_00